MNVDHPHGGGEGHAHLGWPPSGDPVGQAYPGQAHSFEQEDGPPDYAAPQAIRATRRKQHVLFGKGPFVDGYLLKKADKVRESGRSEVIKTWSRRSTILPQFVGLTFGSQRQLQFIPVSINEDMVGHKLGGFRRYATITVTRPTRNQSGRGRHG